MLNCQRRRRLGGLSPYEVENGAAPIGPLDMAGPLQHREVPVDLASMAKVMDQHKETVRFNKDPPLSGARPHGEIKPGLVIPGVWGSTFGDCTDPQNRSCSS
jgi:hypothetical protein